MAGLKQEQVKVVKEYIKDDIGHDGLKTEFLDHLLCDIEIRMQEGASFDDAWHNIQKQIPTKHLKQMEKETLEQINHQHGLNKYLTIAAIALLVLASTFKMLHLPGASILLLSFLVFSSLVMLFGSLRNFYIHKDRSGNVLTVLLTLVLITIPGFIVFKVLHLPGATEVLWLSVMANCIIFPLVSIYFYRDGLREDHGLIRWLESYKDMAGHAVITMVAFGLVFNYSSLWKGGPALAGTVFFVFTVLLTGLLLYSFTWVHFAKKAKKDKIDLGLLIVSSIAFLGFMIPSAGSEIGQVTRSILAYGALILLNIMMIRVYKDSRLVQIICMVLVVYPVICMGKGVGVFDAALFSNPGFNVSFLVILIGLASTFRKEKTFQLMVLLIISSHMITLSWS